MAKLWFNTTGILHDGIGLVLCDECPCVVGSSSSVFSDSGSVVSDSCTSSTCVEVPCCPGVQIPTVLNATVEGGSCAGTFVYIWQTGYIWYSDHPFFENVSCEPFGWYLNVAQQAYAPTSETCEPFQLVFEVTGDPLCGDFTLTITG